MLLILKDNASLSATFKNMIYGINIDPKKKFRILQKKI